MSRGTAGSWNEEQTERLLWFRVLMFMMGLTFPSFASTCTVCVSEYRLWVGETEEEKDYPPIFIVICYMGVNKK